MENRDTFIVCRHWTEAINAMPEEYQLEIYKALAVYGLTGEIPQGISPVAHALLIGFSKEMENNIKRYQSSIENGKKGGRPKKVEGEEKENDLIVCEKPSETQQNPTEPSETQQNPPKPRANLYDYDNDNVISQSIKKNNLSKRVHACGKSEEIIELLKKHYKDYYAYWGVSENVEKFELILGYIAGYILQARKTGLTFNRIKYSEEMFLQLLEKLDSEQLNKIVFQLRFSQSDIKDLRLYILGAIINRSVEIEK